MPKTVADLTKECMDDIQDLNAKRDIELRDNEAARTAALIGVAGAVDVVTKYEKAAATARKARTETETKARQKSEDLQAAALNTAIQTKLKAEGDLRDEDDAAYDAKLAAEAKAEKEWKEETEAAEAAYTKAKKAGDVHAGENYLSRRKAIDAKRAKALKQAVADYDATYKKAHQKQGRVVEKARNAQRDAVIAAMAGEQDAIDAAEEALAAALETAAAERASALALLPGAAAIQKQHDAARDSIGAKYEGKKDQRFKQLQAAIKKLKNG